VTEEDVEDRQQRWNTFHKSKDVEGSVLIYPDEFVVRFTERWKREGEVKRVLDVPCGAGRHTVLLAEKGFDAVGGDLSTEALEMARSQLARRGLSAELRVMDLLDLDADSRTFDAVVSWRSLHVLPKEDIPRAIAEFTRVVRPGGYVLFSTRSDRNVYDSERVGTIVDAPTDLTLEDVQSICSDLEVIQIELSEATARNRVLRDSYWVVLAKR